MFFKRTTSGTAAVTLIIGHSSKTISTKLHWILIVISIYNSKTSLIWSNLILCGKIFEKASTKKFASSHFFNNPFCLYHLEKIWTYVNKNIWYSCFSKIDVCWQKGIESYSSGAQNFCKLSGIIDMSPGVGITTTITVAAHLRGMGPTLTSQKDTLMLRGNSNIIYFLLDFNYNYILHFNCCAYIRIRI